VADRRVWWKAVQFILAVGVIGLAVRALAKNWGAFRAQPIHWTPAPLWLLASLVLVWLTYAVLIEAWRWVVLSLRQSLRYVEAARICMLSNLAKYIPGKVWSFAGVAALASRAGVERSASIVSAIVLPALSFASAIVVLSFTAPRSLDSTTPALAVASIIVGAVGLLAVAILSWPRGLRFIQRLLPRSVPTLIPIPPLIMLAAFLANVVAWAGYGAAFVCLARGLLPDVPLTWFQATTVFLTSFLVGSVAVFAPAGIGPRESTFVLLLTAPFGPKVAVALALAHRILMTIAELGGALPFLIAGRRLPRVDTID
jgi:hypothetical protein